MRLVRKRGRGERDTLVELDHLPLGSRTQSWSNIVEVVSKVTAERDLAKLPLATVGLDLGEDLPRALTKEDEVGVAEPHLVGHLAVVDGEEDVGKVVDGLASSDVARNRLSLLRVVHFGDLNLLPAFGEEERLESGKVGFGRGERGRNAAGVLVHVGR